MTSVKTRTRYIHTWITIEPPSSFFLIRKEFRGPTIGTRLHANALLRTERKAEEEAGKTETVITRHQVETIAAQLFRLGLRRRLQRINRDQTETADGRETRKTRYRGSFKVEARVSRINDFTNERPCKQTFLASCFIRLCASPRVALYKKKKKKNAQSAVHVACVCIFQRGR